VPADARPEEKEKIAAQNACLVDLKTEAQKMAYALRMWTEDGPYGRWFNGRANVDLVSGDFIVLELEKLKRVPVLLSVVAQAVINAATASMYLSDRKKRKLFLFEECGIILKNNPMLKETVEEMYRRARKYNGAVITVFQSVMDLAHLADAGHVIAGNSSFHFYLPDSQLREAKQKGIISAPDGLVSMAESVRLVKPRYGEMVLRTPWGYGVVRCVMNSEYYYLVTTDADEWAQLERLKASYTDRGDDEKTALLKAIRQLGEARDALFEQKK
jgi:conjugal transfer ATP-binding protein TraC